MTFFERLPPGLLRRRSLFLLVHILPAVLLVPGLLLLESDNSPSVFFADDAEALGQYNRFLDAFGHSHALRAAVSGEGLWSVEGLRWLARVEEEIGAVPGVTGVYGLSARHRWLAMEWPPADPLQFRRNLVKGATHSAAGWISRDASVVTMAIMFTAHGRDDQDALLSRLRTRFRRAPPGVDVHISGMPVLQNAMDNGVRDMLSGPVPWLMLPVFLFLAFIYRNPWDVLIPFAFVLVVQVVLFGLMGYMGERLNLVNVILMPLIFVISLATVVHIQIRFRQLRRVGEGIAVALSQAYGVKARPVLWTALTTGIAFGSLAVASVPPVRSVGIWSAVGILVMTLLTFTLFPLLLSFSPKPPSPSGEFRKPMGQWGGNVAAWAVNKRVVIILLLILLMIPAFIGIARLGVSDNLGRYLHPRHPVRIELEQLQRRGIGIFAAHLVIDRSPDVALPHHGSDNQDDEADTGFRNPADQERLFRLCEQLRRIPHVYGAVGSGDLVQAALDQLLVEGEVTDSTRWMALGMLQTIPAGRELLNSFIAPSGDCTRITVLMPMESYTVLMPVFKSIENRAAGMFPGARIHVTGEFPLVLRAQRHLLSGLALSLSITLGCILVIFVFLFRRFRLVCLAAVPNVAPLVLVLGGMGWLGVPLDSVSVMSLSIVLGLAVDDTFHTVGYYLPMVSRVGPSRAVIDTLARTAPAHVLTSVILITGFGACYFSLLLPVSRLSAVAVVGILLALVGDLVLIPALLGGSEKKED